MPEVAGVQDGTQQGVSAALAVVVTEGNTSEMVQMEPTTQVAEEEALQMDPVAATAAPVWSSSDTSLHHLSASSHFLC